MGGSPSKGKPKLIQIDKRPKLCVRIGFCKEEVVDETQDWLQILKKECNDLKDSCNWASHVRKALATFHGYPPAYYKQEVRDSVKKVEESRAGRERRQTEKKIIRQIYKKSELIPEDSCLSSSQIAGQINDTISSQIAANIQQKQSRNSSGSDGKIEGQYKSPPAIGGINNHSHSENIVEQQRTGSDGQQQQTNLGSGGTTSAGYKKKNTIENSEVNSRNNSQKSKLKQSQIGSAYSINSVDHRKQGNTVSKMNLSAISGNSLISQPSYLLPQMYLQRKDQRSELSKEANAQLEEYLITTGAIANHLKQPEHVLCKMFKVFVFNFLKQHEPIQQELTAIRIDRKDEINEQNEENAMQQAILDVRQFIRVMQLVLVEFYEIQTPRGHFTTENLLNFVNAQVFHYKRLNTVLFELFRLKEIENEQLFKEIMNQRPEKQPQDFFVSDKLCLNDRTLKHFKKEQIDEKTEESSEIVNCSLTGFPERNILRGKADKEQLEQNVLRSKVSERGNSANQGVRSINQSIEGKDKDSIFDEGDDTAKLLLSKGGNTITEVQEKNNITSSSIDVIEEKSETSNLLSEESMEQFAKQYQFLQAQEESEQDLTVSKIIDSMRDQPYFSSMKYLLKIESECSPIGKMKMIVKASETLLKCINRYYSKHKIPQLEYLDGDEVVGLFSYLCTKCRLYQLNTHLLLVSEFVTSNLLNSASGYYVISLQASLETILNTYKSFDQQQP